jgi:branched-chain amino acid transport system substrate-binding protein
VRRPRLGASLIGPVLVLALLAVLVAIGLGACGGSAHTPPGDRISGRVLTIYTDLPLRGASSAGARSVLQGEQLALTRAGARIGRYRVQLVALDDSTPQRGGWDPGQTTANVHVALADPTTVGYIGDFNSGATAVAIPLLNRLGIADISPTATAVGLVSDGPGATPGEPGKYYPTDRRTFVRLAPDDAVQGTVQARVQHSLGCRKTFVLEDGEFDGADAAAAFQLVAGSGGVQVVGDQLYDPRAASYVSLATAVARTGANCVLISALPESHAALLTEQVAAALPNARLFATGPLAQPDFVDPGAGGIPATLDARLVITAPDPGANPAFTATFEASFGYPGPFAAYGYEAMRLMLRAITLATHGGSLQARRSKVVDTLFSLRERGGVLGDFRVDRDGDTTLSRYAVYVVRRGSLALWYTASASVN